MLLNEMEPWRQIILVAIELFNLREIHRYFSPIVTHVVHIFVYLVSIGCGWSKPDIHFSSFSLCKTHKDNGPLRYDRIDDKSRQHDDEYGAEC